MRLERLKNKIFLPRGRGHPFPWTLSPAASALRALARILGPSGLDSPPPLHPYRSTVFLDAALAE